MRRTYVIFTTVFFVLLLLPVSWEFAHSLHSGEAFQPMDIFRDMAKPVWREKALVKESDSLSVLWQKLSGTELSDSSSEALENAVLNLKKNILEINEYLPLDSADPSLENVSRLEELVSEWENGVDVRREIGMRIGKLLTQYSHYSSRRVLSAWWRHGFLKGKYLRAFENRLEKENSLVKLSRPVYQKFAWKVLFDPGTKAVPVDSGWLFYRQDVEFLVRKAPWNSRMEKLDDPLSAVLDFKAELERRGIELLVVVIPGKPSIYPELLNSEMMGLTGENFSYGRNFVSMLAENGVDVVNLYSAFSAAKDKDSEENLLYLNTDTHWTPRGAELAAKVIAEKVRRYPFVVDFPQRDYMDSAVIVEREGDVAVMAEVAKDFSKQKVIAHVVKEVSGKPFRDDFRASKVLILGDSYSRIYETDAPLGAGWIAHFALEMRTPVASIVSDGGASTLVREKLARKSRVLKNKKLVIWEFVERDLRFGAEGWKKVRLD
ncbi:MAG: hypothetical protein M0P13_01410 [Fibrobacteraceae bacterium]|nr:hypothetical protein [Fibrobacteraceae bacterium]